MLKTVLVFFIIFSTLSCKKKGFHTYPLDKITLPSFGRTMLDTTQGLILYTSASGFQCRFTGDSCVIIAKNLTGVGNHGYLSIELDGIYYGRFKVQDSLLEQIPVVSRTSSSSHTLKIFKATEAQNGPISIRSINAQSVVPLPLDPAPKIEFIGNSITCGMGNDTTDLPCGQGQWYDQHNAYYSYASIIGRTLRAEVMLSAVSGIGIYRNWNSTSPVMPEVYTHMELGTDTSHTWDFFSFSPDLVCIALGTNDFSDGDGVVPRMPFDSTVFINRYKSFIGTIYSTYPHAQLVLLTSPMLNDAKFHQLHRLLQRIAGDVNASYPNIKSIQVFQFSPMIPKGCSYHPLKEDHEIMASQLAPFISKFIPSL